MDKYHFKLVLRDTKRARRDLINSWLHSLKFGHLSDVEKSATIQKLNEVGWMA